MQDSSLPSDSQYYNITGIGDVPFIGSLLDYILNALKSLANDRYHRGNV